MANIFPLLREEYEGGFSRHHISQKGWCYFYPNLIPSSPSLRNFLLCLVYFFGQDVCIFGQNPDLTKF